MQTLPKERRFETLSYLPPLSDAQITRQLQYILDKGYIPGVEFSESSEPTQHYWTLWKLPLFNATTTNEVLSEIKACRAEYGNCFIRVMGFDNVKQCQVLSFIVHKPNRF
ncbi:MULTISPECIES: ribulose bisphosphate carboxylase small subunit [Microseira]|jgi:ribulose-bisphosphate carboxylase small chain|uniref:Ribulose bisphosphate carboxylase small subunit n=1 Tax=Microseira wollei NIES-4236 TaxID=2530354 RepID=A0AAV3X263_9CYAN|nr:ribulose bisphosphate carboxylase small subunit [Microseira wollei]GET36857.1 ribulose-bisphosphate carboxylase [Microseira wollei NIES-4236]